MLEVRLSVASQEAMVPSGSSSGLPLEGGLPPDRPPEVEEEEEIPPTPLRPDVAVPGPELVGATATSAAFRWRPAEWSLPEHDERQAEYQRGCVYSLDYELQVQQADLGPPSEEAPAGVLLSRVPGAVAEVAWARKWGLSSGPLQEVVQAQGLRSGRFYAARMLATPTCTSADGSTTAFEASASEVVAFRTEPTPPGQMQAPALAQRARNALKLKWSVPDETGGEAVLRYELLISPQPAGWEGGPPDEQGFSLAYAGDERNFKLGKLGPGQRFSFKIRAFNVLGCGPWSLPSTFTTTPSVPAAPDPPVQVDRTEDAATLQWAAPADNGAAVSCYQLEVDDGQQGEFRLAFTGAATQCTVRQLQSGLHYRFRLRAENSEGYSLWSPVATATTAASVPSCPQRLAARGTGRSFVTLSWDPPESDGGSEVASYQVQLQAKTKVAAATLGTNDWIVIFDGEGTATTFSALRPGCQYLVRVAAANSAGRGQFCLPLQLTTAADAPLAPPVPEAEPVAMVHGSLLLRWLAPPHDGGAPVSGYKVEMRCSPTACHSTQHAALGPQHSLAIPQNFVTIYSGPDMCVQVTDLLPGTAYDFRAAALNGHGAGPWSEVGTATTLPAEPLPPPAPQLVGSTASGLSVAWAEPYGQGSPILSYTLSIARVGPAASGSGGSSSSNSSVASGAAPAQLPNGLSNGGPHVRGQHGDPHDDASSSCSSRDMAERAHWDSAYKGPATSAEVRQLQPASRYMLRVRAHNSIGASAWSAVLVAATGPAAPGAPGALEAQAVSSSTLRLVWAPPAEDNGSPVTGYQLEAAAPGPGSGSAWSRVWQGNALSHELASLSPGRSYSLRLRALNACGAGPWGEPARGVTLPSEPSAPSKPSTSGRPTATSVRIKWGLPLEDNGASVTHHLLQLRRAPGAEQQQQQQQGGWQIAYQGADLSAKVTGLQPGSSYELRVAAANRVGPGPWSEAVGVQTPLLPPLPPAGVSAELQGGPDAAAAARGEPPTLVVSWLAPEAAADCADAVGYEVEAAPAAGGAGAATLKGKALRACAATVTGLQRGATYSVRVRAVGAGGAGHSSWSDPVSAVVPAAPAAAADGCERGETPGADGPATSARRGKGRGKAAAVMADTSPVPDRGHRRGDRGAALLVPVASGRGPPKVKQRHKLLYVIPLPVPVHWIPAKRMRQANQLLMAALVLAGLLLAVMTWPWGAHSGARAV